MKGFHLGIVFFVKENLVNDIGQKLPYSLTRKYGLLMMLDISLFIIECVAAPGIGIRLAC